IERQPAAAAERRLDARAIHTIRPMTTSAPSRIHSHSSDEPDSLAAGVVAWAGAAGATVGEGWLGAAAVVAGAALVSGTDASLRLGRVGSAVRVARLEAALLTAPLTG